MKKVFRLLLPVMLAAGALSMPVAGQLPPRRPLQPAPPPDPNLILSYVTVTSSKGAAPRLSATDFQILEDNKEQKIDYFAIQDQPATVGLLWGAGTGFDDPPPDPDVRECPKTFMKNMVPGSEYFVLSGDTVTTPYTRNIELIPKIFRLSGASSDTVYLGLDVLKEGANSRRILLVITNPQGGGGGQLQNTYVERRAITQGYQVHVMSFTPPDVALPNHEGQIFLNEIVELTGGTFFAGTPSSTACVNLARDLRVQYMIGYHSTNAEKDGKWRRLSVKLNPQDDGVKLKALIRRGYYAAKEPR
jgi:Ca-activated chloride channel homolog